MGSMVADLRYAFRSARRAPGFTAVAVLTLALGIGATTAAYSVVASVMNARIPVRDIDRVVGLWSVDQTSGRSQVVVSQTDFVAWRARQRSFEDLSAMRFTGANLSGVDRPVRVSSALVTASYFDVIRIQPVVGRPFTPEENAPGGARVAILNNRLWRDRFEGRADVVGRTVLIDGQTTTIVGTCRRTTIPPRSCSRWRSIRPPPRISNGPWWWPRA